MLILKVIYFLNIIIFIGDPNVVSNLIRFVNEFWFIGKNPQNIEEIIKSDTANNNVDIPTKLKKYNGLEEIKNKLFKL